MAIREYVGARYVPRFTGLYDNTQQYDALDVVDNGMGTSYIAKKTVPAGTALTNTDYWFVYGASSGAIINLQDQINDMNDGNVDGSLQAQINAMKDPNVANSLQNQIVSMDHAKLTRIPYRKFLFMGDSYDTVVADHRWSDAVAANLGVTNYVVRSAGGLGLAPTNLANTWENYLINHPVDDPETITDVVICGGTNDVNTAEASIVSAVEDLDTYIKNTFPKVERIYLGFIGWSLSYANRPKMMAMAQTYARAAAFSTWRNLEGVDNILKYSKYIEDSNPSDLDHPNLNGIVALGVGIANSIATGYCHSYHSQSVIYTVGDDSKFSGSTWSMSERLYNGMIAIQPGDVSLTALEALNAGVHLIGKTPDLNMSSIPRNREYPIQFYNVSTNKWYPARIISEHAGDIALWISNEAAIGNGQAIKLFGNSWTDILH